MYGVAKGLQLGAGLVARSAIIDMTCAATCVVGVAVLLVAGVRGIGLVAPMVVGFALCAALSRVGRSDVKMSSTARREITVFIGLGVIGTLASAGFLQASVVVAKFAGGVALAGQYAAALALTTPISMIAAAISLSLFPMLAEAVARGDEEKVRHQTINATNALVAMMVGIAGPASLLAGPTILFLWGGEFAGAAKIAPLILIAIVCNAISVPSVNSLTSRSNRGMAISAASSVVGFLAGLTIWVFLTPAAPLLGIALGYAGGVLLISATPVIVIWKSGRYPLVPTWSRFGIGVVAIGLLQATFVASGRATGVALLLSAIYCVAWGVMNRVAMVGMVRAVRS